MTLTGGAGASHRPVGRPLTGCEREDVSDGSAAQLTSSADMDDAADPQSLEDRVVDLINEAITAASEREKVNYLQQVQELVIHQSDDILDNFLDEVIAFQTSKAPEVRKFVVGFLELACKKDNECFPKLIVNLNFLIVDENANVAKKAIQAATQLYRVFLNWVIRAPKVTDEIVSTWEVWNQVKEAIYTMIDSSENEGIKTQAIKFMEMLVICQTPADQWSANDQAIPLERLMTKQLTTFQELEEEANRVFEQLVILHGTVHVSSVNLMACMQTLVLIAKQRSQLFMARVIRALEALHANLPPTLAKSQVNSVRKHLKMQLLILLKHPAAATCAQNQAIIVELLSDLGVLQPEIHKCIAEVKKRGIRVDLVTPDVKKMKLESADKTSRTKASEPALTPRITRSDAQSAIDVTSRELAAKLQVLENVTDLVLVSLLALPESMPPHFQATYTPVASAGLSSQIDHVSRLLATQLTAAGLGSGVQEFVQRVTASSAQAEQPADQRKQQIATLIGMMAQEVKKQEQQNEKQQRQDHQQSRIKLIPTGKSVVTPVKLKHVSLTEITKELPPEDQEVMICRAMDRILGKEEASLFMSPSQTLQRQHIISRLCCVYRQSSSNLFDLVVDYVLQDIRSRNETLLCVLYEIFLQCKRTGRDMAEYEDCLLRILFAVIERTELRDRDHFVAKLLLEAPLLSAQAIDCLRRVIENENNAASLEQGFATLAALLKSRRVVRKELLSMALQLGICPQKPDVRQRALCLARDLYEAFGLDVKQQIESFSLNLLSNLSHEKPPEFLQTGTWTEEPAKICLMPYLQLLSRSHKLIHGLATTYVSAPADVKRVILRSIETPVRGMGMNSPELLLLVENCPKGAETLVTRIIHVLTDKQQPSPELVIRVRELYQRRVPTDVRFLIPVLNGLTKKEVIAALPRLIKLNPVVVKEVFNRLLGIHYVDSMSSFQSPITPAELLVALHHIDTAKCDLKTVIKATGLCFAEKNIYTQDVLAVVIQLLAEENPMPTLLMRTVMQTLSLYPRLVGFVMNILQRLILKQVWKQKKIWEGFLMCCQRTMPQSFPVLFQLPIPQLRSILSSHPELHAALRHHVQSLTDAQRGHIPPSIVEAIFAESGMTTAPGAES